MKSSEPVSCSGVWEHAHWCFFSIALLSSSGPGGARYQETRVLLVLVWGGCHCLVKNAAYTAQTLGACMGVACGLHLVKLTAAGTADALAHAGEWPVARIEHTPNRMRSRHSSDRLGCAAGVAQTHGRMQESDLWGALGVSLQNAQRSQATSSGLCRAWRRPC